MTSTACISRISRLLLSDKSILGVTSIQALISNALYKRMKDLTLVSGTIVQQILSSFKKFYNVNTLIPAYTFIKFGNFRAKTMVYGDKTFKFPTCIALFHPASLLIFEILPTCTFIPTCIFIRETKIFSCFQSYQPYLA